MLHVAYHIALLFSIRINIVKSGEIMYTSSRKWQLTINNPIEKGFDHTKIKAALSEMKPVVYYCLADEVGQEGTFHTHVYLCGSSAIRFASIKRRFPEAHIEIARGTSEENRNYITKTGKWENDEKHETTITGSFEEWGELPVEHQGERNDLEALYSMIKDGLSNYEILESNPGFMLRINDIERARQTIRSEQFRKQFRKLDVTYIWGPTGLGKTRSILEEYGYENVFRVTDYKHPFDSYNGQDIIVFDEYHSQFTVSQFLNFLDGYPLELPARYANKIACYTKVYIVSNIDLLQQYHVIQLDQPETWAAILRRINHVITFLPDGNINDYSTNAYINGFVEISALDLPFGDDEDSKPVQMPMDTGIQLRMEEKPDWDSFGRQEGTAETDDM